MPSLLFAFHFDSKSFVVVAVHHAETRFASKFTFPATLDVLSRNMERKQYLIGQNLLGIAIRKHSENDEFRSKRPHAVIDKTVHRQTLLLLLLRSPPLIIEAHVLEVKIA